MVDGNEEIIAEFVAESRESLEDVEPVIVRLEGLAADSDELALIFRCFHSFKGTASFVGLDVTSRLAHVAESLLDLMRKGVCEIRKPHVDVLCKTLDAFRLILDEIETTQSDLGMAEASAVLGGELAELVAEAKGERASTEAEATSEEPSPAESQTVQGDEPEAAMEPAPETPLSVVVPSTDELPEVDMTADIDPLSLANLEIDISEELLTRFVAESEEHLATVEETLVALEAEQADPDQVAAAFRAVHSFKGNAAICGFDEMSELTHLAETLFGELQSGARPATPPVITLLLELLDALRGALAKIPGGDGRIAGAETWRQRFAAIEAAKVPTQPPLLAANDLQVDVDEETAGEPGDAAGPNRRRDGAEKKASGRTASSIRVDTGKLDELMNLVGELIIAETTVTRNPDLDGYEFENFQKAALNLNRITRSLQDIAMQVRMIPIATTFRKMIRLVRDVSAKQGKHVDLTTIGEETEVDKTVVESISDPLVHIIRNAVDHGIESAEDRRRAGKNTQGHVWLEARHQGGEVWITIRDDGKGLDPERLLNKAIDRKIADPARKYSEREIFDFIFAAGFSTAEKVTDISGRGVGMDVVRRNIEAVGGRVEVYSKVGEGTTFNLRIPLTLAIIEGMLVRVGRSYYTIPLLSIQESVKAVSKDVLVTSDGYEMLRLRNRHYPIIRLQRVHKIGTGVEDLYAGTLVIVESDERVACVLVDEVVGQCQTVIKPLPDYLKRVSGLSGCSILHNGEISLILDVAGVIGATQATAA